MGKFVDRTGFTYGKLHVVGLHGRKIIGNNRGPTIIWDCYCECDPLQIIVVQTNNLISGNTKGCGKCGRISHGCCVGVSSGGPRKQVYRRWEKMMARCYNPNHNSSAAYMKKGIKVCEEWHDSKKFIEWAIKNGHKDGMQIHRKDPKMDYCPENCMFVTAEEHYKISAQERSVSRKSRTTVS